MNKTCEHRINSISSENLGTVQWNGPIGTCECCQRIFHYVDSGWISESGNGGRFWHPKNLCGVCGGSYQDYEYKKENK